MDQDGSGQYGQSQQQQQSQSYSMNAEEGGAAGSYSSNAGADTFGPVGAGPPSPNRMHMLPHGTGPPSQHHHHQASSSHPHQQHPPLSSSKAAGALSSQAQQKAKAPVTLADFAKPGRAAFQATNPAAQLQAAQGRAQVYEDDYTPVAPTSGRTNTTKGSSTTSEFTKRKNWSQRIVEEMQDVLHVLSPSGVFLFTSPSVTEITGYTPEELVGRGITDFIERDDIDTFIKDFSNSIRNARPLATYFRFRRKDDRSILFEVTGQPHYTPMRGEGQGQGSEDASGPGKGAGPEGRVCKCLFAMARLYPSKNNAMLDSFLELKMENEKLREKLADVYRDIEGDTSDDSSTSGHGQPSYGSGDFALGTSVGERSISGFPSRMSGVFAAQNAAAAQQAQTATQQQQQRGSGSVSSNDDMHGSGYGAQQRSLNQNQQQGYGAPATIAPTRLDAENVLVSSSGLIPSTSNTYGALGIGISTNNTRSSQNQQQQYSSGRAGQQAQQQGQQQKQQGAQAQYASQAQAGPSMGMEGLEGSGAAADGGPDKKKKQKKARTDEGEFVCRDCGTVDSPEWRRGPLGPKTLCNACGLRWAKKNKQSTRQSIGGAGDANAAAAMAAAAASAANAGGI